jgi:hypothetical protein
MPQKFLHRADIHTCTCAAACATMYDMRLWMTGNVHQNSGAGALCVRRLQKATAAWFRTARAVHAVSGGAAIALGALDLHPNAPICAIIYFKQGTEDFIPLTCNHPHVVQSNKVYLSQEASMVSINLVSRLINAIR